MEERRLQKAVVNRERDRCPAEVNDEIMGRLAMTDLCKDTS